MDTNLICHKKHKNPQKQTSCLLPAKHANLREKQPFQTLKNPRRILPTIGKNSSKHWKSYRSIDNRQPSSPVAPQGHSVLGNKLLFQGVMQKFIAI